MGELVPPVGAAAEGDVGAHVYQPDLTRGLADRIEMLPAHNVSNICVSIQPLPLPRTEGRECNGEGSWWTSMARPQGFPTTTPHSPKKNRACGVECGNATALPTDVTLPQ